MWSLRGSECGEGGIVEDEEGEVYLYGEEEDLGYDEPLEDIFDIDFDYEFDAPRFFDLSLSETVSEVTEADNWFGSSGGYPPSCNRYMAGDGLKAKPLTKPSSSSLSRLMKPTASRLAKQSPAQEIHCERFARRFQMFSGKSSQCSSQRSSVIENKATKRQKLEFGYLRKAAYLAHQSLMLHKEPRQVRGGLGPGFIHARPKYTIPTAPVLLTAHRAERHRSRTTQKSDELENQNENSKARPLNKKLDRPKQESNATCSTALSQPKFTDPKRQNSTKGANQTYPTKAMDTHKEMKYPVDNFLYEPPTDQFNKLSVTSKNMHNATSQQENEKLLMSKRINAVEENSVNFSGKQFKCMTGRQILGTGSGPNIIRNLGVR